MRVTFPHMGDLYITLKVLFDTLGIDCIIPELSRKNLEHGIINSPEFACLPFKITLGDILDGIEKGADHVIFGGGSGQCRFGYYADLHETILKSVGCNIRMIRVDSSNMTFNEFKRKLRPVISGKSTVTIAKSVIYAARTVFMVDRLNALAAHVRCRELKCGETDNAIGQFHRVVQKTKGYKETRKAIAETRHALMNIPVNMDSTPLKVLIVGEIYTSIDRYINMELESMLGRLGVEVTNKLTISSWVIDHGIKKLLPVSFKNKAHEAGKEFFNTDDIGGHGLQTVGNAILGAKKGYDGIIHIYPFTCMPEIVAQCSFGAIQGKYGIPIITLIIDELTGRTGYETRIEAFVDILEKRRSVSRETSAKEAY